MRGEAGIGSEGWAAKKGAAAPFFALKGEYHK